MDNLIFVYGTLKKGGSNSSLMGDSKYLGQARLAKGTTLYSNGMFPMMVECDENAEESGVEGELYEVNDQVLRRLDRLEGHPRFFERKNVQLDQKALNEDTKSLIEQCQPQAYYYKGGTETNRHIGVRFKV